ncbi:septation protein SepH [Gryllotalpicola sp.]|uniref:septation protein SepH n=1 Tax=Gryllotalpicola sp. TaxID=1932787 RepID=UPI00261927EC|nr:septation protein SepH [Gryllotalpicola sp.]
MAQDLKVVGIEDGALIASDDDGVRFRIEIDESLQAKLRQYRLEQSTGPRISPRDVQSHIRAGLSAEDVAELTGASIEYVERFVGPIIAEREHIVAQALAIPVRSGAEVDPLAEALSFGAAIRERLASLGAHGERWASWKEPESGWFIKLEFTADGIDHDARWAFDARKSSLAPANAEANTLSQHGEASSGLIPRLRAVPLLPDESRFDSGAFDLDVEVSTPAAIEPAPTRAAVPVGAIRTEEAPKDVHDTADLLEALRKRRGERQDVALYDFDADFGVDGAPEDDYDEISDDDDVVEPFAPTPLISTAAGSRKGRASMPSWDEIVFGSRSEEDPA